MRYFPSLAVKASNLKFGLMSSVGLTILGLSLSGCQSITVPEPKYPVYMMDRPASSAPVLTAPPVEAAPYITPVPSAGEVTTNYLPPAPSSQPPAPPPAPAWTPAPQPVYAPPPPPVPVAAQPSTQSYVYAYVMQPHDTLYGVSRRFGVTIQSIYAANNLTAASPVSVGQKVLLPATARDKGPEERASGQGLIQVSLAAVARPVPAPPPPPVIVNPPLLGPPVAPPVTPLQPQPPLPNKAFPGSRDLATLGQGMFIWPTRGTVHVKYGQLAPNVRNDGLNIAAPKGTPVYAAADGVVLVVLTVQNQTTRDLGNTIYVQNGNGWYTGYSHLDIVTVKAQQRVKQGQIIGTVGQTGAVDRPQLHFEIRYTPSKEMAKPIDPNLVLPAYR